MIVYVGAGGGAFRDMVIAAGHGQMVSRQAKAFRIPKKGRWAFDNGAFTDWKNGVRFDNEEFLRRVRQISEVPADRLPDFCVCPDMVAASMSLEHSLGWKALLADYAPGLKWYLALQDYVHPADVDHALCLERFDGLFVGGSTGWKWDTAGSWVEWGHARGLPVHIARVNGPVPADQAERMGADSIDGTGWVRAGEKWAPYLRKESTVPERLFSPSKDMPRQWVRFGAWLREIYASPEDWKAALLEEQDRYDWIDSVWSLTPEEFVEWYNRAYPGRLVVPKGGFSSEEEYSEWAMDNLAYAIRFFGMKPAPPTPAMPKFVIDEEGKARMAYEMPPGTLRFCPNTMHWFYDIAGPAGVITSFPVVSAPDKEEAQRRFEETKRGGPPN